MTRPDAIQPEEVALEPALSIVDAHHHLRERGGERFLLPEFLATVTTGHRIVATVAVETAVMYRPDGPEELRAVGETEFLNEVADTCVASGVLRAGAGIVGAANLGLGDRVRPVLEAHIAAAGKRFRGVRSLAAWDASESLRMKRAQPPAGLLLDRTFREGFAELAAFGLSFDTWIFHTQLADVMDLARAFPDTAIILNHVGGPIGIGRFAGRHDEVFTHWRQKIREVAQYPNIFIKLGGLGMPVMGFAFAGRQERASSLELANAWYPYIETCIELIGPVRCMFESNFPSDRAACSYEVLWNAFKRIVRAYSDSEKAALFRETAIRAYQLTELPAHIYEVAGIQ